jgi:hypothetical protein
VDICVTGDVHGHMQLALLVAARWQLELGIRFEAVLLCGDIGAFSDLARLDKATRRHAEENPCELEMVNQWMPEPPSPWLSKIFEPLVDGGLGLTCPVIAMHGNHEDFELLERIAPSSAPIPTEAVAASRLPRLDPGGRISFLPSGWRVVTPSGLTVGAIGGIQPGQRPTAGYPPRAYIAEDAVLSFCEGPAVDALITHQRPAAIHGTQRGSDDLDAVLECGLIRSWFHGHSVVDDTIRTVAGTTVVPLHGVPVRTRGPDAGMPRPDAWCWTRYRGSRLDLTRELPRFWREFDQQRWIRQADGQLIAPQLVAGAEGGER